MCLYFSPFTLGVKQSIRNEAGDVFYQAEYNAENQWIYVQLSGNLTLEDIRRASDSFVELFKISSVRKLINDTSAVTGEFKGIEHWTIYTKMTELSDLGLDHYAHIAITDKRKVNRITLGLKTQGIEYKVFKNLKKAKKWISEL